MAPWARAAQRTGVRRLLCPALQMLIRRARLDVPNSHLLCASIIFMSAMACQARGLQSERQEEEVPHLMLLSFSIVR